jgi:hypothetical protein
MIAESTEPVVVSVPVSPTLALDVSMHWFELTADVALRRVPSSLLPSRSGCWLLWMSAPQPAALARHIANMNRFMKRALPIGKPLHDSRRG